MARVCLLAVMIVTCWGGIPTAAAESKKARADAHKAKAFGLFEQRQYAAGIAEMERAYALIPHPGFLLNIALAYDRWPNHCAESLETFERFFLECESCNLLKSARKKHSEIETTCRVAVSIRSTPEGGRVAVDGSYRGKTPFSARLLPGHYSIVVDLSGHERAALTLDIERGKPQAHLLKLIPQIARVPPPPPGPEDGPLETSSSNPSVVTWVGFGVGGAGLITGATFTALTLAALHREEQARLTPLPKAEIEGIQREARRDAIVAYVGYGVGIAGIATGVILYFVTGGLDKELDVVPAIGPNSLGWAGTF